MTIKTLNIVFQRTNIIIFLLVAFSPSLWMFFGPQEAFSFAEKRLLATFPSMPTSIPQVKGFFSDIDSYLNDNFGFRDWMIFRYQREVKKRFGINTVSKVHKGTNDWYYFAKDNTLENFTGRNLLNANDLNKWIETYRAKQRWLEKQGILYLFVVPPDKPTIYGEFIGEPWLSEKGKTRLSQLKSVVAGDAKSLFLDLSPTLMEKARDEILFFKSDTHWTPYGAYLGYLTIAEKLESLIPGMQFKKDFTFSKTVTRTCEKKSNTCGDLTNMLLDYDSFEESFKVVDEFPRCAVDQELKHNFSNLNASAEDPFIAKSCPSKQLRVLVFRDSFFQALEPYFSENFKEVIYLWKGYDQKNIEELLAVFKPDIVIEEEAERSL